MITHLLLSRDSPLLGSLLALAAGVSILQCQQLLLQMQVMAACQFQFTTCAYALLR